MGSKDGILSVASILYTGIGIALCLFAGAVAIGVAVSPILLLTAALIGIGIYAINRYTDSEDLINRPESKVFFQKHSFLLHGAIGGILLSILVLHLSGQLTLFHLVAIFLGIAYSVRLIPWYSGRREFVLKRLKDVTFGKSFSVSFLLAGSFFLVHWMLFPQAVVDPLRVVMLATGCSLLIFVNTNFCDILDVEGDCAQSIPTLPVRYGVKNTFVFSMLLPSLVWFLVVAVSFAFHVISVAELAFFTVVLLYPLTYLIPFIRTKASPRVLKAVADLDFVFYALCLFSLSAIG